jgi:hypothetical protein
MGIKFKATGPYSGYLNPIVSYRFLETINALSGQKIITTINNYVVGNKELEVYLNGQKVEETDDYIEVSANSIEFAYELEKDDKVVVISREIKI